MKKCNQHINSRTLLTMANKYFKDDFEHQTPSEVDIDNLFYSPKIVLNDVIVMIIANHLFTINQKRKS